MITSDLKKIAAAMAEFEGWHYATSTKAGDPAGSVAYRNHNPGNLRWSPFMVGTQDKFAVFVDDETGRFAMIWDIWKKARGETSSELTGESNLYDLIHVYSAEDLATVNRYAAHVESRTGIPIETKLKDIIKE